MKILIATGIYPPEIGGPAQYAKSLSSTWRSQGHSVSVKIFSKFIKYPWGLRHIIYCFNIIPSVLRSDYIVALDAFDAGIITLISKPFSKKVVFRTGGDMLWELYTERTGEKVLLKDFYLTKLSKLSSKEKLVFYLMRWTLRNLSAIVWSTAWQRDIFMKPYGLSKQNHFVIENYYGPKEADDEPDLKLQTFVASGRNIKLKNMSLLKHIFNKKDSKIPKDTHLFTSALGPKEFMDKLKSCYVVMVVSFSEISPNIVLDAIRFNRPFICTREVGIFDRIRDAGIFVDPLNETEIEQAILRLLDKDEYEKAKKRVKQFYFVHSWEDIATEFIDVYKQLK